MMNRVKYTQHKLQNPLLWVHAFLIAAYVVEMFTRTPSLG